MSKKIPLLVVTGPTASGKTQLAIDLAKHFDGEIVGADSMQIYKYMNIGTAKPTYAEMQGIPHYLIDFLEPLESFSVAQYVTLAKQTIDHIRARSKLPVLAGGTGLYISSLLNNISFEDIESDAELREELKQMAEEKGAEYLHEQLKTCDPSLAEKLHPNNLGRIIRGIEVFKITGKTMTELQEKSRETPSNYDACVLGLCYRDREKLYSRINLRVDKMFEQGLLEEAKKLLDDGLIGTASQAIGYKELARYFAGEESLIEAKESIKQETRRYAKRQMTWLRRDTRVKWLYVDEYSDYSKLHESSVKLINFTEI